MKHALFDKIWNINLVKSVSKTEDVIYIDRHYIHEVTSPQAFDGIRKRDIGVYKAKSSIATADHNVPTAYQDQPISDPVSAKQVATLQQNCKEFGVPFYGMGHENHGIVHVIGPDTGNTLPGMTIVCGDSHTSTHGAFGAIAFGIGTTQVEQVLATQCLILKKPKRMKIEMIGELPKGCSAKDVILFIISKVGTEGATGYFVEYAGEIFSNMSMEARMTVCNMSIEMGARGGLMGVDQVTLKYLKLRVEDFEQHAAKWKQFVSDEGAVYDKVFRFYAKDIHPTITVGTSPETGVFIHQKVGDANNLNARSLKYMGLERGTNINDISIDFVFIGSCTNGRIEDLRSAAKLIAGRKKADHVNAWVVPGSLKVKSLAIQEGLDIVFEEAGFQFKDPGCSACLAMNDDKIPSGAYCVSTSNRNFEGRQGHGARTLLASPETAVASALTGKITDPRTIVNY